MIPDGVWTAKRPGVDPAGDGDHAHVGSPEVAVCVLSDQPIVAAGVYALLEEHTAVGDHRDADVVVYDAFRLAVPGGATCVRELEDVVAAHPGRVLVLSRLLQPALTARALAVGAAAPVSVSATADELAALVDAAAAGAFVQQAAPVPPPDADQLGASVGLTRREYDVLRLIAEGHGNQEIADELDLSINTVKTVVRSTYRRIGVRSRREAIACAVEHGYVARAALPQPTVQ